jgi:hypothetical protein
MLELLETCHVVVASRLIRREGVNKSLNTFLHYRFFPFVFKKYLKKFRTSEPITGMRLMRKETWNNLRLKAHDFLIETEMEVKMARKKMHVVEIPIPCIKRIGRSKWDSSLRTILRIRKYILRNEKYLKDLNVIRYLHV